MKKPFLAAICALPLLFSFSSFAQSDNIIRVSPCDNQSIQQQADSVKHLLANGGFSVLREASITMESEYEIPIIVPMNEGTRYQFVFIGDVKSNLYEVRMYDYNEKQVVYQKKKWGDADGNIISYSYVPKMSEYHMIKPLQVNAKQKKDLCGYVMLFRETETQGRKAK
ncbi:hypothetical protein [Agriterribacter sp.]|uniref:hypothetical protein n=1 Tax=Agriterribacter sp. TaxID=2821509 RepID=UPI002BEA534B|nr:hypothetical protein [Agriterribacter sp.]HTN06394.1 hypothetical protein [Agriterribacter sp.]